LAIVRRDIRNPYPEPRYQALEMLGKMVCLLVFTPIPDGIRVISLRKGQPKGKTTMAKKPNPGLIDDDAPELTDAELAEMRPASQVLPPALYDTVTRGKAGRPPEPDRKIPIKLRLDPDIVAAFKATGEGWQTRMNDALRGAKIQEGTAPMTVSPKSRTAMAEILNTNPETPSRRVAAELRQRGYDVPKPRAFLQALCAAMRAAVKHSTAKSHNDLSGA
jgi:uncharacterized protein (DUF4415 family)